MWAFADGANPWSFAMSTDTERRRAPIRPALVLAAALFALAAVLTLATPAPETAAGAPPSAGGLAPPPLTGGAFPAPLRQ
jgi:hypothetical protein